MKVIEKNQYFRIYKAMKEFEYDDGGGYYMCVSRNDIIAEIPVEFHADKEINRYTYHDKESISVIKKKYKILEKVEFEYLTILKLQKKSE